MNTCNVPYAVASGAPALRGIWLRTNGVPASYGGANYQQSVIDYVNSLTTNGIYAIVDLHWSAPGAAVATSLRPMPDADHAVDFWRSVATAFADNPRLPVMPRHPSFL